MALTDNIETTSLIWMHWLAGALAIVSGVVHLVLGVISPFGGLAIAFVLAGLGYFGGVFLALVDYRRPLLYLVGVVFTLAQIVAYYFLNYVNQPEISTIEGVDKAAQVLLIVLLLLLYRREAPSTSSGYDSSIDGRA